MDPTRHQFELERATRQAPSSRGLNVTRWTLAGVSALGLFAALVAVDLLAIGNLQSRPRPVVNVVRVAGAAPVQRTVYLSVGPGIKPGPAGRLHDAFSITSFTVHAGQPVKLVINNTDNVPHSITSTAAGVNIVARPGVHSYRLLVAHPGKFIWHCAYPCDPYSMRHLGYMMGTITAI